MLSIALGSVVASTAMAQGRGERPRYVLQALDADHDGMLSAAEILAAPAALTALDRNGDGELTPDEMEPLRTDAGATSDQLVAQLMTFDKNKDGVLTADELPERMQSMFVRGDKNKDGKLTTDEIRLMATRTGSPNGRATGPGTASGMMRMDPVLNALDANHDGVISAAEIKGASVSLLVLDVDHDGSIAAVEMRVRQQTPAERVAHMLDEWDTNKDGKLSKDEVPDGMRGRFADVDTNGDGFLDAAELTVMYQTQPPMRGGNGGAPPPSNK
jgi:Ca2+-binding EF-hand superfamily protein